MIVEQCLVLGRWDLPDLGVQAGSYAALATWAGVPTGIVGVSFAGFELHQVVEQRASAQAWRVWPKILACRYGYDEDPVELHLCVWSRTVWYRSHAQHLVAAMTRQIFIPLAIAAAGGTLMFAVGQLIPEDSPREYDREIGRGLRQTGAVFLTTSALVFVGVLILALLTNADL